MSADPAVEAARRALVTIRGHGNSTLCEIEAAREALKPIRELHRPTDTYLWATTACERNGHETTNDTATGDDVCLTCTSDDGGPQVVCADCFDNDGSNIDWPCSTARLVYSESELGS